MSTSINLKRMYNKAYTRSVRATHPDPTIMVFFDANKAFDSVWDIGVLHKAMSDRLPSIFIRLILDHGSLTGPCRYALVRP